VALPGLLIAFLFFLVRDCRTVDLVMSDGQAERSKVSMKKGDIAQEFARRPSLPLTYLGFWPTPPVM